MRPSLVPVARMLFILLALFIFYYSSQVYELHRLWAVHGPSGPPAPDPGGGWPLPGVDPLLVTAYLYFWRTAELTVAVTVLLCVLVREPRPRVIDREPR